MKEKKSELSNIGVVLFLAISFVTSVIFWEFGKSFKELWLDTPIFAEQELPSTRVLFPDYSHYTFEQEFQTVSFQASDEADCVSVNGKGCVKTLSLKEALQLIIDTQGYKYVPAESFTSNTPARLVK